MSIDSMRVGGGRCPPFLVIGLSVVCIMMICNWWTLSSTNLELLHQIDELNEQIKISVEERDQCVTQIENSEKKLKTCQDKAVTSLVKSSQNEDLFNICNTELKSLKGNYESASATMEAMKMEIKTLKVKSEVDNKKKEKEVDQLKDELTKAKEEVEKLKLTINAPQPNKVPDLPAAPRKVVNKAQLGPVLKSSVHVKNPGQEGLKFHGIPILPQDPPGAIRKPPRFSVLNAKQSLSKTKTR
ncbi:chromosome partition protein Smc-like isoform X3 [Trichogramma pretiosum]|uniref:chromosome partition protein Smc-like isoform X3 n=1 Tax=Trichogramma pretiosum TaxID=7493 RepID=UPI000C71B472|nr:chromosome partition protein Smc-like isoform X3 [Trichogramma pretiosum]